MRCCSAKEESVNSSFRVDSYLFGIPGERLRILTAQHIANEARSLYSSGWEFFCSASLPTLSAHMNTYMYTDATMSSATSGHWRAYLLAIRACS